MARDGWRTARRGVVEAFVIMAGVLLALGADEWRQGVDRKARELVLLQELRADFLINAQELESITLGHQEEWDDAVLLIHIIEGDSVTERSLTDVVGHTLLANWWFDATRGALDSYLNGGDVGIISNPSLRSALAEWPRRVDEVWQQEARIRDFVDRTARDFLIDELDALSLSARQRVISPDSTRYNAAWQLSGLYRTGPTDSDPSLRALMDDRRLLNLATVRLGLTDAVRVKVRALNEVSLEIARLLDAEIARLE